jgi:hypothetical protein
MENNEKFLSLEWFKDNISSKIDKILSDRVSNIVDSIMVGEESPAVLIKLINDTLTVVLRSGEILSKPSATEDHYLRAKAAHSEEELYAIVEDRQVALEFVDVKAEAKRQTAILDGYHLLSSLKDFTISGDVVCLKGTSRSIPPLLVEKFTEVIGRYSNAPSEDLQSALDEDDEYQGLKNFFMWCCLNPRAEVAASLYDFLEKNGMKITKQGFFVALRNVVVVKHDDSSDLVQFISNAYNKVKAVWKKNPAEYCVLETEKGLVIKQIYKDKDFTGKNFGNLTQLYLDLPNMAENRFTDNWTKTFDIRIGQVVSMPSEKCNWSTQDCAAAGLHFAGHTAPYVLCGDTTVFTLHNPMKVVDIGVEKGRCWEYLPFMTTNIKEANAIMTSKDFDFFQLDEAYALEELQDLEVKAKEGFTVESSKYQFNMPSISSAEINSIVLSLNEMTKTITKRVSLIE